MVQARWRADARMTGSLRSHGPAELDHNADKTDKTEQQTRVPQSDTENTPHPPLWHTTVDGSTQVRFGRS